MLKTFEERKEVVLQNCQDLKAFLISVWGPNAVSLGTTAVERAWWPDHVRNMNKTARWATGAWRQHRAVVAWKHDVEVILRKAEEPLKKGRGGTKFVHAIEQTLALLQKGPRQPIRLGTAAGKSKGTDQPRCPQLGEVFLDQCLEIQSFPGQKHGVTTCAECLRFHYDRFLR